MLLSPFYQSQWPDGLKGRPAAACLLRLQFRILPTVWMFDLRECCVLSRRGLCYELITRTEELHRLWCVALCDLEISRMRRSRPELNCSTTEERGMSPYLSAGQTRSSKHRMHPENIMQLSNIRAQHQLFKMTLKIKLKTNKCRLEYFVSPPLKI